MSYQIVRLVALDWSRACEALRTQGVDFYWLARDDLSSDIDMERVPYVAEYNGPLANCPGRRDPEAHWIYQHLRPHLLESARAEFDACFLPLFWDDGGNLTQRDVVADGTPIIDLWNALAPETVRALAAKIRLLPWPLLEHAAELAGPWESRYLPTFDDFEHHLDNHRVFLTYAARRGAGVVGLVSA
jgi:hypothetical protein